MNRLIAAALTIGLVVMFPPCQAQLAPDQANQAILDNLGAFIPAARKQAVRLGEQIRQVDEAAFNDALRRLNEDPAKNTQTFAFVDSSQNPPIVYIRPGASDWTVVHELLHVYQNPDFRSLGRGINEGLVHVYTGGVLDIANLDSQGVDEAYGYETAAVHALVRQVGDPDIVKRAALGEGGEGIRALREAVDRKGGAGTFGRFISLLQYDTNNRPIHDSFQKAIQLMSTASATDSIAGWWLWVRVREDENKKPIEELVPLFIDPPSDDGTHAGVYFPYMTLDSLRMTPDESPSKLRLTQQSGSTYKYKWSYPNGPTGDGVMNFQATEAQGTWQEDGGAGGDWKWKRPDSAEANALVQHFKREDVR